MLMKVKRKIRQLSSYELVDFDGFVVDNFDFVLVKKYPKNQSNIHSPPSTTESSLLSGRRAY